MKVLVTGAEGQVGQALSLSAPSYVELHALAHTELDIADESAVAAVISALSPDLIINAAAYTAVDKAESEPALAERINSYGPRHLATSARRLRHCRLLHISTDYVFNGTSEQPYRPDDATDPLSVYGRTKRAGELAVLETLSERSVVLRTAWVYAGRGRNFVLTMLRLMRERGAVRVVSDQKGTPTAAVSVAEALWRLAERPEVRGVLHWTDAGVASWYDFAQAISQDGARMGLLASPATVTPITTADYPTAARRPASSVLDVSRTAAWLQLMPVPWRDRLRGTLETIQRAGS